MSNRQPFSEELRQAVIAAGMTHGALSRATGVGIMTLSRFSRAERGLSFEAMDALADFLDIHVTTGPGHPANQSPAKPAKSTKRKGA